MEAKPLPSTAGRDAESRSSFGQDLLAGLTASPKRIPPKWFYDPAGSELFERITELPEYYPTRTEVAILREHAAAIAGLVPAGAALVEFGTGSTRKARILLGALDQPAAYVPVDISGEFLEHEATRLRADRPDLLVAPVVADFTRAFLLPEVAQGRPRAGFFPGSTIGNFEPDEAVTFLRHARQVLGPGALLVVGVDLVKDEDALHAAYNDAAGVTAAFNLNVLRRANRELGATFDLRAFEHRAFFNPGPSRIEMHLASRKAQTVRVLGRTIPLVAGETIHTENSYKYTLEGFRGLAAPAGWTGEAAWTDRDGLFSVHALRADAPA